MFAALQFDAGLFAIKSPAFSKHAQKSAEVLAAKCTLVLKIKYSLKSSSAHWSSTLLDFILQWTLLTMLLCVISSAPQKWSTVYDSKLLHQVTIFFLYYDEHRHLFDLIQVIFLFCFVFNTAPNFITESAGNFCLGWCQSERGYRLTEISLNWSVREASQEKAVSVTRRTWGEECRQRTEV